MKGRMVVYVKHAPDLIWRTASTTPILTLRSSLVVDGGLHHGLRRESKPLIDHDGNLRSVASCPGLDVLGFWILPFAEDINSSHRCASPHRPA